MSEKHVIYTEDLEPITIINVSPFILEQLNRWGSVQLPVITRPALVADPEHGPMQSCGMRMVVIQGEKLYRGKQVHMLLTTGNEETALLLKCAFLPGQTQALNEHERNAFAKGFMEALVRASRL